MVDIASLHDITLHDVSLRCVHMRAHPCLQQPACERTYACQGVFWKDLVHLFSVFGSYGQGPGPRRLQRGCARREQGRPERRLVP